MIVRCYKHPWLILSVWELVIHRPMPRMIVRRRRMFCNSRHWHVVWIKMLWWRLQYVLWRVVARTILVLGLVKSRQIGTRQWPVVLVACFVTVGVSSNWCGLLILFPSLLRRVIVRVTIATRRAVAVSPLWWFGVVTIPRVSQ